MNYRAKAAPAVALLQGQTWLRKLTAGELADKLFAEIIKPAEARAVGYSPSPRTWRRYARKSPDERPCARPFYRGPFTYIGA